MSSDEIAESLLDCCLLAGTPKYQFDVISICSTLEQASLSTATMSAIKSSFTSTDPTQKPTFDGQDCTDLVAGLASASCAIVIPNIAENFGFNKTTLPTTATSDNNDRIDKLIPYLFADYLNTIITSRDLPNLATLAKDKDVVAAFTNIIQSEVFDPSQSDNTMGCMAVLFVSEYLYHGPGLPLASEPTDLHSASIMQGWAKKVQADDPANAEQFLAVASQAAATVWSTGGGADVTIDAYITPLQQAGMVPNVSWTEKAVDGYQSLAYQVWYQWTQNLANTNGFFFSGVASAINVVTPSVIKTPIENPNNGHPAGYHITDVNIYGDALLGWETSNTYKYFQDESQVNNVVVQSGGGGSACFIPGTKVLTDQGPVNIESLSEGHRVLTRADSQEYGITSDEIVAPRAPTVVYGFNDEPAFFSSNHVFYTTTGLRALDAVAAHRENPWLEVSDLRVGHRLLHTVDGKTYEEIPIRSIQESVCGYKNLHGVHLREGLRSYHANGYRVAVNYPEITIASIAQQMAEFPQSQKLKLLSQFKELMPLFHRFGGQTVLDALEKQTLLKTPSGFGPSGQQASFDLRRFQHAFAMERENGPSTTIGLEDGILVIDGEHCENASIGRNEISWSRPVSNNEWEHAHCRFYNNGLTARGYLYQSQGFAHEPNFKVPREDTVFFMLRPAMAAYKYSLTYDATPVTPENLTTGLAQPIDMGQVLWSSHVTSIDTNRLSYPIYDTLQQDIINYAKNELSQGDKIPDFSIIDSLYKDTVWYNVDTGMETHELVLDHVGMIIQASDQFNENSDVDPATTQLTFKAIGSDVVLPMLFQTLTLTFNSPHTKLTGTVRMYEPRGDGCNGNEYLVAGSYVKASTSSTSDVVESVSVHRENSAESTRSVFEAHSKPSSLTSQLKAIEAGDRSTEKLAELPWNQSNINVNSQTWMKNIMLYHMDEKDRTLFFSVKQPTNLPAEFTTLLDQSLKDWLRNTYANAYICQVLSQSDLGSSRSSFTAQEIKNIDYFWRGKGKGCLSRSKEYKTLETRISRYLVIDMHNLQDYKKDYNGHGGVRWSQMLLEDYGEGPGLEVVKGNTEHSRNMLTKLCTIMDALDNGTNNVENESESTNANELVFRINADTYGDVWKKQYWALKSEDEEKAEAMLETRWTVDVLADMIYKLLTNDQEFTNDIYKEIREKVKQLIIDENLQGETNKRVLANRLSQFVISFIGDLVPLLGLAKRAVVATAKKIRDWTQGVGRTSTFLDNLLAKSTDPQLTKRGVALKGLMVLAGTAFLTMQIVYGYQSQWANSSTPERAQVILNTMGAVNMTADAAVDAIEALYKYRNPSLYPSPAAQAALEAAGNTVQGTRGVSKVTNLLEETGSKRIRNYGTFQTNTVQDIAQTEKYVGKVIPGTGEVALSKEGTVAKGISEALPRARRGFNIARKSLQVFGQVLAIAVAVFMAWQLAQDWDSLDVGNRVIQTMQVALAGLEAIMAFVTLTIEASVAIVGAIGGTVSGAVTAGFAALTTVFSVVGMVLAVVAVALLVALFIYQMNQKPPKSPLEVYIDTKGKTFANSILAPDPRLTVTATPSDITSNKSAKQTVTFNIANNTAAEVKVQDVSITFNAGEDATALFYEPDNFIKEGTEPGIPRDDKNIYRLEPADAKASIYPVNLTHILAAADDKEGTVLNQATLIVSGPPKEKDDTSGIDENETPLILAAGASIRVAVKGIIYAPVKGEVYAEIEETQEEDNAITTIKFTR